MKLSVNLFITKLLRNIIGIVLFDFFPEYTWQSSVVMLVRGCDVLLCRWNSCTTWLITISLQAYDR